ncbi:uncharacterized protein LOC142332860 [Lycorma delicatula]|uniref:uncharacterized protein LOC142332860 n=1 Tax=Lycorma delicatula TaxID=130591 RepID=UPI003F50EA23
MDDPYIIRRIGDVTIERVLPKHDDQTAASVTPAMMSKETVTSNKTMSNDIVHGDSQQQFMNNENNIADSGKEIMEGDGEGGGEGGGGGGSEEDDEDEGVGINKYESNFYKGHHSSMDNYSPGISSASIFSGLNEQQYGINITKDWKLGSAVSLDMVKPTAALTQPTGIHSLPESDDIQELAPVGSNSIKSIDNPLLMNKIDNLSSSSNMNIGMDFNPMNLPGRSVSSDRQHLQQIPIDNSFGQNNLPPPSSASQQHLIGANIENNTYNNSLNSEKTNNMVTQNHSSSSSVPSTSFIDGNINSNNFIGSNNSNINNDGQNFSINSGINDGNNRYDCNTNIVQSDYNNSHLNNSIGSFSYYNSSSISSNNNNSNSNSDLCSKKDYVGGTFSGNSTVTCVSGGANTSNPSLIDYNLPSGNCNAGNNNYNLNNTSGNQDFNNFDSSIEKQHYNYNVNDIGVRHSNFNVGSSMNMDYKMGGNVSLDVVKSTSSTSSLSTINIDGCDTSSHSSSSTSQLNRVDDNQMFNPSSVGNSFYNNSQNNNSNNDNLSVNQQLGSDGSSSEFKIGTGVNVNTATTKMMSKIMTDDLSNRNEKSPASNAPSTRPSSVNSFTDNDDYKKCLNNEFRLGSGVSLDIVRPKMDNKDIKVSSDISINIVRPNNEVSPQDCLNSGNINNVDNKNDNENAIETLKSLEMLQDVNDKDGSIDEQKKIIKLENILEDELDPEEEEEMFDNMEDDERELEGEINKAIKMEVDDDLNDEIKDEKINDDDAIEDEADDELGEGDEEDEDGKKRSKRKTIESDEDSTNKADKKKQKSGNSDDSSSDSDSEKGLMERKTTNLRRNIREVMDESQLDQATLNAQRQEMERLRRVQEQHRIIREVQKQIAMNKQNSKTQTRVISLLQGNTSVLKSNSGQAASGSQSKNSNTVVVKLSSGAGAPQIVNKKVLEMLRNQKSTSASTNTASKMSNFAKNLLNKPHMMTPSVSIAPVKPKSATCETSTDGLKEREHVSRKTHGGKQKGKDVVTISSSSSDEDDCILISEPSGGEDEEEEEDPTNSGMHTNDLYNILDEQGRVLINVGKPDNEPEVFLAPQIARVIKPHQIGGVRFLFDNVVESLERFKTSSGFGCILAHSMGLGKTLQVVSFCDVFLRYTGARSVLCIMPINTLQNWVAEFNMWLPVDPSNCPLAAHGEVRPRNFPIFVLNDLQKTVTARAKVVQEWSKQGGVLLIGYELYRQLSLKRPRRARKSKKKLSSDEDVEDNKNKPLLEEMHAALVKPGPDLVICDEGHRIKNSHASISQALKQIRSKRRIVLTGYPLQNNLLEYWCMVDFVRPNYLGTKTEFSNMFERPIQNGQCIDSTPQDIRLMRYRAHVLHSLLEGFVQRRSHSVLTNTLPQKEEYVLLVRMTAFQRQLYDTFMNEVVRTKAVPNPLKAFAVCCKIWNHPDVLYQFLKKRSNSGEAVDLDLDETAPPIIPGTPTTGSIPGTPGAIVTPTTGNKRGRGRAAKTASPSQNKRERKDFNSRDGTFGGVNNSENNLLQPQQQQQQNFNSNTDNINNVKHNEFNKYDQQWDVKLSPNSSSFGNKEDCIKKDDTEMKSCGNQTDDKSEIKTETIVKDTTFSFGEMKEISGPKCMKDVSTGDKAVGPDSKDDIKELQMVTRSGKEDPGIPYDWAERLLKGYIPGDIEASAKMAILFCILEESMSLGDRILVFSQSLFTLNLIEEFLQRTCLPGRTERWARNWNYYRLDGSTSALEREKLINEFNSNPNIHLFLVSTRAGSLGINLVGANRVIVFDASWNPCHDTQAVCRVYRYGQKKPCFVYRLVMDNCLEKKIYDRQINKQGMADRVVDECNPDAHLSIKEVTNLCWDSGETDSKPRDMSQIKDKYIDVVMQKVLDRYGDRLSKEPFQHESLLVDRKDKKLSQAEKRLAKRSYELEKQANINSTRPVYGYTGTGNQPGLQIRPTFRAIRGDGVNVMNKPMASVRPMQSELNSQLVRETGRPRSWIPAEVWQKQGMSAQEMTLPLDVVIPTNSPDRSSIVLKAGQKVMVLKSPKGIYMQLENGKIIAIRTAFKVGNKGEKKVDKRDFATETKKEVAVQPTRQRVPTNLPMLRNNSNISIIPRNSPGMTNRGGNTTNIGSGNNSNQSKPLVRMLGNSGRPWGTPKQPIATTKPYFGETPPVTVTVTKKKVDASTVSTYRSDVRIERDHIPSHESISSKDMSKESTMMDPKDTNEMQMMKMNEQKEMNAYNHKDNINNMPDKNELEMSSGMSMDNDRRMNMHDSHIQSRDSMEHQMKSKHHRMPLPHHFHHHPQQHPHQHHHDEIHSSDEDEFDDDDIDDLDMNDDVHNVSRSSSSSSGRKLTSIGAISNSSSLVEEGVNCNLGIEEQERMKSVTCDNSMAPISSVQPVRSDDKDKEFTARYPHMSHHIPQKSTSTETHSNPPVSVNPLPMLNSSITVSPVSSVSSSTSMSYNVPSMSSSSTSNKSSVSINPLSNNPSISLNPGTPSVSINPIPINPSPTYHTSSILPSNNRKYTGMEYTADSLSKSSNETSTFPPALSHLKSMTDHSISIFPVESSTKTSTPSSTITSNSPYNTDFNYRQDFQTRHLSGGRASEYYPSFTQPQLNYPSTGYYPSGSSQRKDVKDSLSSYPMSSTYDSGYGIPPNPFTAAAVSSNYPTGRTAFSPGASTAPSTSSFPPPPPPVAPTPTTQANPYGSSSNSSDFSRMYSAFHRPEPSTTNYPPSAPQGPPAPPQPHQYNPYNYNPFLVQPHPSYPHVPPTNTQNTPP